MKPKILVSTSLLIAALASLCCAQSPRGSSWPQWGGPNRDHKSEETGLLQVWPEAGPPVAWKFTNAGIGYSSVAVHDGKLYTMGLSDGTNFAICLDADNGQEFWRHPIAPAVDESEYMQGWAGGPRSTPTIAGEKVLMTDDGGTLCALNLQTGELLWQVSLVDDFGGRIPKWGYSASPLVDGERVVVCPGEDNFLVALDIETGELLMSSSGFSERAHYVSVIKHTIGTTDMYITAASAGLVGFSATTGETLWTNGSSGNGTATIPTPIVRDNFVYHTSDYGTGCVLVELAETSTGIEAAEVYQSKNMQNHHGGVVLLGDSIFGLKRNGGWVCHDFLTGELRWNERLSGDSSASVAMADGRFYIYGDSSGTCYLVEPSNQEWLERGQVTLPEQTTIDRKAGKIWSHPVIAEKKLFLRDMDLIYAFDIAATK